MSVVDGVIIVKPILVPCSPPWRRCSLPSLHAACGVLHHLDANMRRIPSSKAARIGSPLSFPSQSNTSARYRSMRALDLYLMPLAALFGVSVVDLQLCRWVGQGSVADSFSLLVARLASRSAGAVVSPPGLQQQSDNEAPVAGLAAVTPGRL